MFTCLIAPEQTKRAADRRHIDFDVAAKAMLVVMPIREAALFRTIKKVLTPYYTTGFRLAL
jgi:hypothetical protein